MGCAASTSTVRTESHDDRDRKQTVHHYNQRDNDNHNTNTNTNTNTQTTTNGTYYPDDNAIYGYDLYEDDNQKGGNKGGQDQSQDGAKGSGDAETDTQEATDTQTDTNTQVDTDTKTETNANENQYDDAGFFGQTETEKGEQELFDGGDKEKTTDDTAEKVETQDDVIPADETVTQVTEEEEKKEVDVIVPVPTDDLKAQEEEKVEESQPEPEPEPQPEPEPEPELKEEKVEEEHKDSSDGVGSYTPTSTGLMTMFMDLRTHQMQEEEDSVATRPSVSKGDVWEDSEFGLHSAIAEPDLLQSLSWKRPSDISASPTLFSEGTTRFDIGQGGAGTCWFLSTVANISEHPEQLKQVIPDDAYRAGTEDYDGVFHCRFWRFGQWEDVYIDDFLPIVHGTIPWGARSATDENEFWVPLLEKSFARYHGNYQAVYGGQPGDAYLALTGGVAERIDFDDNEHKPNRLYRRIHNAINSGALVTCTVPEKYDGVCGLVGAHAYSLTGTGKAKNTKLIRVRNPWGNTEWTGPWSDQSQEWAGVPEEDVARVQKDDGEFWICLEDFMTYFDQTTICSLTPDFDQDGSSDCLNYVTNVYGQWHGETAAGFREKLQNPRFLFTVPESESEVALVVQLIQRRKDRQVNNFQVRCDLYKVMSDNGTTAALELLGENTNSYCPETQCSFRHKVTPGTYAVVPSTIDPGLEKSFLIRLFSACPLQKVGELSREHKVMACDQLSKFSHNGEEHALTFCKAMPGQWKAGVNAGGQIGNRDTHASNPQYVISVKQPTLVAVSLMQEQADPRMPLGMRLFPSGEAPLSIERIYELYEQAVDNTDGQKYKFVEGWDVNTAYMLDQGEYTLLLHMNEPDTEKLYTLVLKSSCPVDVREFQTGM